MLNGAEDAADDEWPIFLVSEFSDRASCQRSETFSEFYRESEEQILHRYQWLPVLWPLPFWVVPVSAELFSEPT